MKTKATIYALYDPRHAEPRYIGSTQTTLAERLRHHVGGAKRGRTPVNRWVKALLDEGVRPTAKLLDEVHPAIAELNEERWVRRFRDLGAPLVNATEDGGPGRRPGAVVVRQRKPFVDDTGVVWTSQRDFARTHNVSQTTVSQALSGKLLTAAGHRLRYLQPMNPPTLKLLRDVLVANEPMVQVEAVRQ